MNSVTKLSAKLLGPLAFGVGYTVNYDSAPPAPRIPWDTTLALTLDDLLWGWKPTAGRCCEGAADGSPRGTQRG